MALKKNERKPDNIQTSSQMTLSTKNSTLNLQLYQFFIKRKTTLNTSIYSTKSMKKENLKKRRNSTI
jgi:hypothetical protein